MTTPRLRKPYAHKEYSMDTRLISWFRMAPREPQPDGRQRWRLLFSAGLALALVLLAGAALYNAVLAAGHQYRFRSIPSSIPMLLGPGLLLYGGGVGLTALLQRLRGGALGWLAWEGAAWALAGSGACLALGQPRLVPLSLLALGAAALGELRPRAQRRLLRLGGALLSLALGVAMLLPLFWMLVASLRGPDLPQQIRIDWWPEAASLANYARLAELLPLGHYLRNSLLITGLGVPLSLAVASAAGFALVHVDPRLRRTLLALSLIGIAIPGTALWLPRFVLFGALGLLNTPLALLYPALLGGTPLGVLLCYLAFRRIPSELWDQGRLDGAGPLQLWWRIGLPLTRPALLALAALFFTLFWGNSSDALFYLTDRSWQTAPVGLRMLQLLARSDWPVLLAAATAMTLPGIGVFLLARRALLAAAAPQG
jgi:multiple sugar transport system permease protein